MLKIPRGDTNGVGEDEVIVTSGLHAQAERTKKQIEERELHSVEAQTKIRSQVMLLNHGAPGSGPRAGFAENLLSLIHI